MNYTETQIKDLMTKYIKDNAEGDLLDLDYENAIKDCDFLTLDDNGEFVTDIGGETLQDCIQQYIYEYNVIYYSNAMHYLIENDTSLQDSLELAKEQGCEIDNLSSEYLATILCQDIMTNELNDLGLTSLNIDDLIE